MSSTEIVLIIAGIIIFALGYLLPARKKEVDDEVQLISEDEIRKLVAGEVEEAKEHISDIVDETITYAMEKTERSMERVTNEKIMAVNEYSDTVLEEINKNHKEVLFLYDMLNDKHETLKNTVAEAAKTAEEVKQTVKDAEITAREAQEKAKNVMDAVLEAVERAPEEIVEIHDTVAYNGTVIEEVQQLMEEESRPEVVLEPEEIVVSEDISEPEKIAEPEVISGTEEVIDDFLPIAPPRVEIIHNPDGDYVAEGLPEEELSLADEIPQQTEGFQAVEPPQMAEEPKPVKKKTRTKKASAKPAEAKTVDIQFANGKDNGRNNNERILELHKAGKSNMAIAKELGLGIGEVKLVIDLFEGL